MKKHGDNTSVKNKILQRIDKGLKPKKYVKPSKVDDRSLYWKLAILFFPFSLLMLLPVDLSKIFPIVLVLIGIPMTYKSIQRIRQFSLSDRWKTVTGELLYKKVAIDNPFAADRAKSYFPYMKYSYKVDSKTYVSDTVANYRELRDFPEEIEEYMEQLTRASLKVHYNPEKHAESLLVADMPLHRKIFWIFIFILGFSSVIIGVMTMSGNI